MPQRRIRWVEGTVETGEIRWNRLKTFSGKLGDRRVESHEAEDWTSEFARDGQRIYSTEQFLPVQQAAAALYLLIFGQAKGGISRFHYDGEVQLVWWDEGFTVGGSFTVQRHESTDERMIEAGQAVLDAIALMLSTTDKPVSAFRRE